MKEELQDIINSIPAVHLDCKYWICRTDSGLLR